MKLAEMIQEVLQTGVLSLRMERQLHRLLVACPLDEESMTAIDQLMDALRQGIVQPIA